MPTAFQVANDDRFGIKDHAGDLGRELVRPRTIDSLEPGCIAFGTEKLDEARLRTVLASAPPFTLICHASIPLDLPGDDVTLLRSDVPRLSFMRVLAAFFGRPRPPAGIAPSALIDASAVIDPDASIGPFCVVGARCEIGAGSVLHAHVTIYDDTRIGANVTINSGTVVGADGFGYERNDAGELEKFPHVGGVRIEDEVEIGSNTSIDRGSLGDTILRRRARIDNQVHIAHNVVVGEDAAVIAQAMIGGSVKIGARAWIAPAGVIMNQIGIGDDAVVGLGAVVVRNVPDGVTVMGSPAVPDAEFRASRRAIKNMVDATNRP